MSPKLVSGVVVRRAKPADAPICGPIAFDAFNTVNQAHGFACDFPGLQAATAEASKVFSHPGFYCVAAEADGRIVGSN